MDMNSKVENIKEILKMLLDENAEYKTNYEKLLQENFELNEIINKLKQDIKLKDSQINAFERSGLNKLKNQQILQMPDISPPKTPPPIRKSNDSGGPNYVVVVKEESPSADNKSDNASQVRIQEKLPDEIEFVLPDEFEVIHLDDTSYYRDKNTDDLYEYKKISKIEEMTILGKLKSFKIKSGKQYISNTITNKVYNMDNDGNILDYCGMIINGKFKLNN